MIVSEITNIEIRNFVGKIFNVREGEGKKIFLLWVPLFSTVIANYLLWNVLQTLFIKRIGIDSYPLFLFISSLAILAGSLLYTQMIAKFRKVTVMQTFNIVSVLIIVGSWFALQNNGTQISTTNLLLIFIIGLIGNSAFLVSVATQIWGIVNDVFTASQGKRLFPLIGVAGTVGGISAGAVLQWIVPLTGVENMLLVAAIFILVTAGVTFIFKRKFAKELNWYLGEAPVENVKKSPLKEIFSFAFSSRLVLALAAVILIHMILERCFNFVFAEVIDFHFQSEEDFLRFNGIYLAVYSIVSVAFDIFLLNRIIQRIGLTRGMFVTSNVVTVFVLGMAIFPILPFALAAVFARDIILSLQNSTYNIMVGLFSDTNRIKIHAFIDGWMVTIGGVIGSIAIWGINYLLPRQATLELSIGIFSVFILCLLIMRFLLNIALKKEFFNAIEHNVEFGDIKTKQRAIEALVEHKHTKRAGISKIIDRIKDDDESISIKESAIHTLGTIADPTTLRILIHQLSSAEPSLRLAAAKSISSFDLSNAKFYDVAVSQYEAIEELRKLFTKETDPKIREEVINALIHLEDDDIIPFILNTCATTKKQIRSDCLYSLRLFHDPMIIDAIRPYLKDSDPVVRNRTIVALWQFPWEHKNLQPFIEKMIKTTDQLKISRLNAKQKKVLIYGLKTIGDTRNEKLKQILLDGIHWTTLPEFQLECALSLFKMGNNQGSGVIREFLEKGDIKTIERIRFIAKNRIADAEIADLLGEAVELTMLKFPATTLSSEELDIPIATIPELCLTRLRSIYYKQGDTDNVAKMSTFMDKIELPAKVKGQVLLISPRDPIADMYEIALLANGYYVHRADKPSDADSEKFNILVIDDSLANRLSAEVQKKYQKNIIRIIADRLETQSHVAKVKKKRGYVYRCHYSPSELLEQVGKTGK